MSRIELHCPSCGYDVPMTLLPPPQMFECPECQEVMPREKLTRLKVLHRHIAGPPKGDPFVITPLGTFSGGDGIATVFTCPFTVRLSPGDLFLLCASNDGAATMTAQLGGTDNLTTGIQTVGLSVVTGIYQFSGTPTNAGPQSVAVTCSVAPNSFCAAMLKIAGQPASSPIDKTKGANAIIGDGTFTTTATAALTFANELAVSCVGFFATSGTTATFNNLFVIDQSVVTGSLALFQARKQLSSAAAVTVTGNETGLNENTVVVVTIKPA